MKSQTTLNRAATVGLAAGLVLATGLPTPAAPTWTEPALERARKTVERMHQDITREVDKAIGKIAWATGAVERAEQRIADAKASLDELTAKAEAAAAALEEAKAAAAGGGAAADKALEEAKAADAEARAALSKARSTIHYGGGQVDDLKQKIKENVALRDAAAARRHRAAVGLEVLMRISEGRGKVALKGLDELKKTAAEGADETWRPFLECVARAQAGDGAETVKACDAGVAFDAAAQRYLGLAHFRAKHYEQAIARLDKARIASADGEGQLALGRSYAITGNPDKAITHLRRGLVASPNDPGGHEALGVALAGKGYYEQAIGELKKVVELAPGRREVRYHLARAYDAMGDEERSRAAMDAYLGAAAEAGGWDRSFAACERGLLRTVPFTFATELPLSPSEAAAHLHLGIAAAEKGDRDRAQAHFDQALALSPDDADVLFNAAVFNLGSGRLEAARGQLEAVLAGKPDFLPALVDLAEVELRWGAADKAIELLGPAASARRPDDRVLITLAVAHAATEDPDKARQLLGRVGRGDVLGNTAQYDLAVLDYEEGRRAAAQSRAKRLPTTGVTAADLHVLLGLLAVEEKDFDAAIEHLREALGTNGSYLRARRELGRALMEGGQAAEARRELEAAVALDPGCPETHVYLGMALGRAGDAEAESAELRKAEALRKAARERALGEAKAGDEEEKADDARHVAVVRFLNASGDEKLDWLSLGIAEALSGDLGRLSHLIIIERGQVASVMREIKFSSLDFVDETTAPKLGKVLGADALVVGSFQRAGDQLRIQGRLVDLATRKVLRTGEAQGTMDQLFEVQRALALDLVGEYAKVSADERRRIKAGPKGSVGALEKVALTRAKMLQGDKEGAREAFRQAMAESPDYVSRMDELQSAWEDVGATLAVLPFQNTTGNPEDDWLGEGVATSLSTDLQKIGLYVVERMALAKVIKEQKFGAIVSPDRAVPLGKQVGASIILIGSYQVYGGQLQIDARMVDVETSTVVLSEQVKGREDEVFDLQAKLAQAIAETLELQVSPEEIQALVADKPNFDDFKNSVLKNRLFVMKAPADEGGDGETSPYLLPAVAGGGGLALAAAGAVVFALGHNSQLESDQAYSEYRRALTEAAIDEKYARADELSKEANVLKTISYVSFGVAAAAIGYSAWGLITGSSEPESKTTEEVTVEPTAGMLWDAPSFGFRVDF